MAFARLNRRMHSKSPTADASVTILGGRNIGNEYFDAKPDGLFDDLDVLAMGSVVAGVRAQFDSHWTDPRTRPIGEVLTRISAVQLFGRPPVGEGHAQHTAEKLFHRAAAADAGQRAEHVGERAVPAFLQRVDGDDVLDLAGGVEQIDAVQLPLIAGRDRDATLGNPAILHQVALDDVDRSLGVFARRLCLIERDRADPAAVLLGDAFQPRAVVDGVGDGGLPATMLRQVDRQLDHVRRLQFRRSCRDDDVRANGRRGELHHGRGRDALDRLGRERRGEVMRLVDDD